MGLTWPPSTEEALIGEAHLICYDLTWGWTPQQIADDVHAHLNARGVTLLDVGTMVNAARSTYCPGNVCWPVRRDLFAQRRFMPSCAKGRGVAHITGAIGRVRGVDHGSNV